MAGGSAIQRALRAEEMLHWLDRNGQVLDSAVEVVESAGGILGDISDGAYIVPEHNIHD
jgi:butyrate kinase